MAKEPAKKMTFEEALKILKGDVYTYSYGEVQEALRVVKAKDPNHAVLKEFAQKTSSFEKENNLEEKTPDTYQDNYQELEGLASNWTFDKFKSTADNKDIVEILDRTEITDDSDGNEKVLDAKAKDAYLNLLFEAAKLKAETVLAGDKDFAKMNKRDRSKLLKEEIKTIFFADFAQTAIASSLEKPTRQEQKLGTPEYRNYVIRQSRKATEIFNNILQGGKKIQVKVDSILSSCADTASRIEKYIGALKQKAQALTGEMTDKMQKGVQSAGKAVENGFSKLAASIQTKKNKFEKLANEVSKNRYEIWKNIKGSFSDNKFKLIGNVAANAAFGYWTAAAAAGAAGAAAAPVLVPAVAAYAAYHAAGSWVFPVIAEMRKINRKKKEAGEEPLKFKDALKQAWKNKMNSRKDKRSYIIGGVLNTGLAVAGLAWLKDGLEAADAANALASGAKDGLNVTLASNIAETRHAISLGRAGTATVAQLTDASIAYAVAAKDPDNKEKSTEFKQAATSALIGLGFNIAFQGLGFARGKGSADEIVNAAGSTQAVAASVTENPQSPTSGASENSHWFSRLFGGKSSTATDTTAVQVQTTVGDTHATGDTLGGAAGKGADIVPETVTENDDSGLFPTTYTSKEEMGITRNEYNILVRTTEGTLKAATGDEVTLDRAYMNLEGSMEHFPGKTKEEIIYKFNRLYAFMRKAYEAGDGTLRETPSGHDYLSKRFETLNLGLEKDKMTELLGFARENTYASKAELKEGLKEIFPDGLNAKDSAAIITTIHSNQRFYQYQQEMEALISLLGCGNQISAQQAVAINNLLDKTDDILATGKENTQLTGLSLAKDCHDDDGQWRRIDRPVPEPEPEPEPEPKPVPPIDLDFKAPPLKIPDLPNPEIKIPPVHVDPIVQEEKPRVRKGVITAISQLEGGNKPVKEEILDDEASARMLRKYRQKTQE